MSVPTVLGNMLQPGFPFARVFTVFFLDGVMVFAKTGSGGTNASGTMKTMLGGATAAAMTAGAIGSIVDAHTQKARTEAAARVSGEIDAMLAAHKRNFAVSYADVVKVAVKGPNFAGEVKVQIDAVGGTHKFRIDKQSKGGAERVAQTFRQFLPGKVVVE